MECSATYGTSVSHFLLARLRNRGRRGDGRIVRARGVVVIVANDDYGRVQNVIQTM